MLLDIGFSSLSESLLGGTDKCVGADDGKLDHRVCGLWKRNKV